MQHHLKILYFALISNELLIFLVLVLQLHLEDETLWTKIFLTVKPFAVCDEQISP